MIARADLLARYDHDERLAATYPDTRREELPNLVRHVDTLGQAGIVVYSRLDARSVEDAIADQMAYFGGLGLELEWKAYAHDRPTDLVQRLAAHGFQLDESEAILVLDLRSTPGAEPGFESAVTVRRVEHPHELEAIGLIRQLVYGDDGGEHVQRLRLELEHDPAYLSVYLAYVEEAPAACGWIRFPPASAFASLWGGSTVPALRGRGAYTALLAARVREARERGARYLTVDARSMSRPILERRGFQQLTSATACTWSPRS